MRAAGSGGLAHRTEAGFVVVTSADGHDIISLIEDQQNEPDLIDQIVAHADGLLAFAMLFTAGGDLYLVAAGSAVVTVTSASARLSMAAMPREVLVQPVNVGLNEQVAHVRLHAGGGSDGSTSFDLPDGTSDVGWAEIAIGLAGQAPELVPDDVETQGLASEHTPETQTPAAAPVSPAPLDQPAPSPALVVPAPMTPASPDPVQSLDAEPNFAEPVAAEPVEPDAIETNLAEPVAAEPVEPDAIEPSATEEARLRTTMVLGVTCPLGHHNHPEASFCTQCGTKMVQSGTTVLLNGPRPPLGILVVDDGTTYSLNEDLIIGREPTSHADVERGLATPMILSDESLALSRQHARIVLDDWTVSLVDLLSSNGTFLSRADQDGGWAQLEKGGTIELLPGDRIRIGGRTIQVEIHTID